MPKHKKLSSLINPAAPRSELGSTTGVFKFLKTIPKGKITTYGAVAKRCKVPGARNVGWILKQNTNPNKIPCYKVVRSDGRLAKGYEFGGPAAQKRRLLADGILFTPLRQTPPPKMKQHSNILENVRMSKKF